MPDIEWRPVPAYESYYEVSSDGRIRSLDRTIAHVMGSTRLRGRILRASPAAKGGHLLVDLYRGGQRRTVYIHQIVARVFIAGEGSGLEVCHADGDPANNVPGNLRWGTHADNTLDSVAHGTHNQARKTHCPKLHPYDGENTYTPPSGRRYCRTCKRERERNRVRSRSVSQPKIHPYTAPTDFGAFSFKEQANVSR